MNDQELAEEQLKRRLMILDQAGRNLLEAIRKDARIADNMEDVWKHQRCGAEL